MKKLLFFILCLSAFQSYGQFITTWKTDNPGVSTDTQITIPTTGGGYNYDIYWEEVDNTAHNGTVIGQTGSFLLDFGVDNAGTYRVSITGSYPQIYFSDESDNSKLLTVEQWGNNIWGSMTKAFNGCNNLSSVGADAPNLSSVTSMSYMFLNATSFNGDLSTWDVNNVTNMSGMFENATSFNSDLSTWDVSNVGEYGMRYLFKDATSFNGDLSTWNVSNITSMYHMFLNATSFNQDLSTWNVSGVTNMIEMFHNAASFNQDLSSWDVSSVNNVYYLFNGATVFNQDLSSWDVSSLQNITQMLSGSGLSTSNYDATLIGWTTLDEGEAQIPTGTTGNFGAAGLTYCAGGGARSTLTNAPYNWFISGDAPNCTQTITFEALTDKTYGDIASFDLTASTNCNLEVSYMSLDEAVATIEGSTVTIVGVGTTTITASQSGDGTYDAATNEFQDLTVNIGNQTITFEALADKVTTDANFDLTATGGDSGNAITFTSSDEAVATISGIIVTIVGVGTTTITASQAGNAIYNAATDIDQDLVVNKVDQTITFDALADKTFGDATFELTATGGASGSAVSYVSSNEAVATISGSTVTIVGGGITTITASQAGNANYNAATDIDQDLVVNKVDQTITFDALADKTFGDATFELTATGGASGSAVSYVSSNEAVATISGSTVTIVGGGITTITASQAGNANYNTATDIDQDLTVIKADQTITFATIDNQIIEAGNTLTLGATASSGLDVSYEIVSGPATVAGKVVTFTSPGMVTVSASQVGSDAFFAATEVEQSFEVITVTGVEKELVGTISFYPNPVTNYITVQSKDQLLQVEVLDMSGKQMMIEHNVQLDISQLKAGNYLLKVMTTSEVSVHQFIKQ